MQKAIKWFSLVLALAVAIFITFFLISINSSSQLAYVKPLTLKSEVVQEKPKKVWLDHFSKAERSGHFYPVNEVYIKVDLDEDISSHTVYKLSASLLDPYQIFCLKEELKRYKLKYSLQRNRNSVELFIFSKNKGKLNALVKVLKNYQISAKVMPYKEEV